MVGNYVILQTTAYSRLLKTRLIDTQPPTATKDLQSNKSGCYILMLHMQLITTKKLKEVRSIVYNNPGWQKSILSLFLNFARNNFHNGSRIQIVPLSCFYECLAKNLVDPIINFAAV